MHLAHGSAIGRPVHPAPPRPLQSTAAPRYLPPVLALAQPTIRPGTDADRAFVLDLSAACFGHLGDYRQILAGWAAHPGVRITIAAEPGGAPIGYAMQAFVQGEWDLYPTADLIALAVTPRARRRGVARLLLDCAVDLARAEAPLIGAADTMRLEVAADNTAARALFEGAGFRHRPRGDGRYPNGQRYLCLERRLAMPPIDDSPMSHR